MAKFVVAATVDDPKLDKDAKFTYKILDNDNYIIDDYGGVCAKPGYTPKIGDQFTVEVTYVCKNKRTSKKTKTFTVKA